MDPITRRGTRQQLASLVRKESSRGSLLALVGLDLFAFAAAATLAVIIPEGFDAAATSANEAAIVFPVGSRSNAMPDVLNAKHCVRAS